MQRKHAQKVQAIEARFGIVLIVVQAQIFYAFYIRAYSHSVQMDGIENIERGTGGASGFPQHIDRKNCNFICLKKAFLLELDGICSDQDTNGIFWTTPRTAGHHDPMGSEVDHMPIVQSGSPLW